MGSVPDRGFSSPQGTDVVGLRRSVLRARSVLLTMALVGGAAAVTSMFVLYRAGLSAQEDRLDELAHSQAQLIDAIARFDAVESQDADPAGAWVATLGQVAGSYAGWRNAHSELSLAVIGPGSAGDVLHVLDGKLFAPHSPALPPGFPKLGGGPVPHEGPFETKRDGTLWLSALAPIPSLGMSVLVRLDLEVLRRPLRQGLWISGLASLILVGLGLGLLRRTGVRSVEELRQELVRRQRAEAELEAHSDSLERAVESRTRELRQAEAELLERTRLATLGQLTAKVSHELRNPLGTIRASLHTLRERTHGRVDDVERVFQRLERNVIRCDRIIEELLTYTRPRTPALVPLDLSAFSTETLGELDETGEIVFMQDIAPNLWVCADADDVRRMLINLTSNAVDAVDALSETRQPGARHPVCVSVQSDGDFVVLTVRDQGIGMSEGVRARAMEPLFSTKGFGVGLGLPIVKELAERNHATFELTSREGEGTTASLRFSLVPTPPETVPASSDTAKV